MESRATCAHPRLTPDPTTGFAACAACGQPFVLSGAPSLTLTLSSPDADATPAPHLTAGGRVQSIPLPPEFRKRFELGRVLGRGAAGMVVEAITRPDASISTATARVGEAVAVKFFGRLESPEQRSRFVREGQILGRLRHPHLIRLVEVGELADHPYLVMELVTGGTLRDRIKAGPLSEPEAVRIALEVLGALELCHRSAIVHRDLKPENVLFDARGAARLADLGIARTYEDGDALTLTGTILGTPAYMSPEVAAGDKATTASDLHGMGLLLFEMLTGQLPYRGKSLPQIFEERANRDARPILEVRAVNPELARVISRALARRVADRFGSAAELARALKRIQATADSRGVPLPPRQPGPSFRPSAGAALGVGVAVALCLTAVFHGRRSQDAIASGPQPVATHAAATPSTAPAPSPVAPAASSWALPSPASPSRTSTASVAVTPGSTLALCMTCVERIERMAPGERAGLRTKVQANALDAVPPGPAARRQLASERTQPSDPLVFHQRLRRMGMWRYGEHARRFPLCEQLALAFFLNPVRAAAQLDDEIFRLIRLEDPAFTPPAPIAAQSRPPSTLNPPHPRWLDPSPGQPSGPDLDFRQGCRLLDDAIWLTSRGDPASDSRLTAAITELTKACAASQNRPKALARLGAALAHRMRDLKDLRNAERMFDKARQAGLTDPRALLVEAQLQGVLGNGSRRRELLARAVALDPALPGLSFQRAFDILVQDQPILTAMAKLQQTVTLDATLKAHIRLYWPHPIALRSSSECMLEIIDRCFKGPLSEGERLEFARRLERDPSLVLALMWLGATCSLAEGPGLSEPDPTALLMLAPLAIALWLKAGARAGTARSHTRPGSKDRGVAAAG